MWRSLTVALMVVPSTVLSQTGVAAIASPLYELVAFNGNLARLNKYTAAAFRVTGTTYDTDRVYVCVQDQKNSWKVLLFRFQAREVGGPFLTGELYQLVEERSVALSPTIALRLTSLLKELASPESMRSGVNADAKRFVTVSYFIAGGVEYPENEILRYMPLLDGLCASLQRGDDQPIIEKMIETFFQADQAKRKGPAKGSNRKD